MCCTEDIITKLGPPRLPHDFTLYKASRVIHIYIYSLHIYNCPAKKNCRKETEAIGEIPDCAVSKCATEPKH